MNRFKIYAPEDKFYISNNLVVYSLLGLFLLSGTLGLFLLKTEEDKLPRFSEIMFFCVGMMVLVVAIMSMAAGLNYKPLRGNLESSITFEADKIIVDNKIYSLEQLSKISFTLWDYKGMLDGSKVDLDGRMSQGVDNSVALYLSGKKEPYIYRFQLERQYRLRDIREQLIQYHLAGKLHFLQLIDILGITKYEDIQEFKREMGSPVK